MRNFAWKPILITFALSFVLGTAFGRWESSHLMRKRWHDTDARQQWILKRMDSRLNLNSEQEQKIAGILKETAPQWEAIREEMRPKFDAARQQVHEKIRPLLSSEQKTIYDQMENEWRDRKEKFRL